MVLKNLSEWLFPGDGDGETHAPKVDPRTGAAGLLVAAAHRDGSYTDIERDTVTAALMKLFMLINPEAKGLREKAEEAILERNRTFMTFAVAAKGLDKEDQENLITHLWRVIESDGETTTENVFISSVRSVLGFSREQAEALRPTGA